MNPTPKPDKCDFSNLAPRMLQKWGNFTIGIVLTRVMFYLLHEVRLDLSRSFALVHCIVNVELM